MGNIETWFPCSIYYENNLFSSEQNQNWGEHCLHLEKTLESGGEHWQGNTFTSLEKYDLRTDSLFLPLITEISKHVHNFAREMGSNGEYTCQSSWFNINRKGTFQEYHTHSCSIFSCIYYVQTPQGSGGVIFKDPKEPDMLPVKDIPVRNGLSYQTTKYGAEQGKLLIFRSYLEHFVEPGINEEPRISIALNFV